MALLGVNPNEKRGLCILRAQRRWKGEHTREIFLTLLQPGTPYFWAD